MEGIYRVPGRQSRLEALRESYDKGRPIELEAKMEDPFTCADLLLLFLRSMSEPLFPQPAAGVLEAAGDDLESVRAAFLQLPCVNQVLLSLIVRHAAKVAQAESVNKMGLKNVTIVFVPSLYCSPKVFSVMVTHAEELFSHLCETCGAVLPSPECCVCSAGSNLEGNQSPRRSQQPSPPTARASKAPLFARVSRASSASAPSSSSTTPVASVNRSPLPRTSPPSVATSNSPTIPLGVLFGRPLLQVCRRQKEAVVLPSLLRQVWKYVESAAPNTSGLYISAPTVGAASVALVSLRQRFDNPMDGSPRVQLAEELRNVPESPLVAAALFHQYLGALPEPLFGSDAALFEASNSQPAKLSQLVFNVTLELRTFLLHFISHIRTVVKHDLVPADRLLQTFADACRCSSDLLTAIYNNRRTILQPNCSVCDKLISLNDSPSFSNGTATCGACNK